MSHSVLPSKKMQVMKRLFILLLSLAVCACDKTELAGPYNHYTHYTEIKYPSFKIGDRYSQDGKEGIIFAVSDDGQHGKIVSIDETKCFWSTKWEETGASDENDGMKNLRMIQAIEGWHEKYPAFAWCADKGKGWYLPALNELKTLYESEILVPTHSYWSSTERNDESAWYGPYGSNERNNGYVRAVSAF